MRLKRYNWKCFFPLLLMMFFLIGISCKKFVQIPPASNLIVDTQVFSDSADANAAVVALYLSMVGNSNVLNPFNASTTIYGGLAADELYSTRGLIEENAIYANGILSSNGSASSLWATPYQLIYKTNAIIGGLSNSKGVSSTAKNQFVGEAKMVRAFCYFNLVNIYGQVPLVTTTDYKISSVLPRTSVDSVYDLIISDLKDAQTLLTDNYPTAGRVRPNLSTATALLSRVYLYRKSWQKAVDASSGIINNSSVYSLESDLNNVFLSGSSEAIWQLIPAQTGYETAEGYFFVPTSTTIRPKYVISNFLLGSFEANDLRKSKWLKSNTVGGQAYYYPYKYKLGRDNNTSPKENLMIFRTAEQYLIRAEAKAQLGDLDGAKSDLDAIRTRAGLGASVATTKDEVLSDIYHEKRIEFFCEGARRWFDLKATDSINTVMSIVTPAKGGTWSTYKELFPIYTNDLLNNQYLVQNPGY